MMRAAPMIVALALAFVAANGRAQRPLGDSAAVGMVDSLYFALQPGKSLLLSELELGAGANEVGLHWRAARADIALGMMIPESPRRKELYDSALAHAHRALALAPTNVDARYWVAAAAGRRSHRDDPMLSIKLAYEVYEQATAILAADSMHAGAHHALGALNAEVMRAPGWIRFVAGRVLRMDLANRANWADAELHLTRATQLEPGMMMYMVDLANLYGRVGRTADTDRVLARLGTLPLRHPADRAIRDACIARWQHVARPTG